MTIILTGGGSGGHITPILAVAAELKRLQPSSQIIYIGQVGDRLADVPKNDPNIDAVYLIAAGKLRRFHGEGLKQLLDLPNVFKNVRDSLYVAVGLIQSWRLLKRLKPDIIFSRGSYISVPVCLVAGRLGIPYITHDSDPVVSLTNRIIAKRASLHAVALPKALYPYPKSKIVTTGIPLNKEFVFVTNKLKEHYRRDINVPVDAKLLFIIGGGLGSQAVNQAVIAVAAHLLGEFSDLYLVHAVGQSNEAEATSAYQKQLGAHEQGRVQVYGFLKDVYKYSGAADLVVTRAGATNLAEFAVQGKAAIVLPSSFLVAGHQLKNAQYLADQGAAVVLSEEDLADDPNRLAKQISSLLKDETKLKLLAKNLSSFARLGAAAKIAELIIKTGQP